MKSLLRVTRALLAAFAVLLACASAKTPQTTSNTPSRANEPIEIRLQKMVPSLLVTRSGDGVVTLQTRSSTSSFNGNDSPPLFVLNNLAFQPGPGGALIGINSEDITSIKFLRGADAAIWGIQGANGVIVITTKMAGKQ